ncbi:type II toxin-antitoxin system VapC family toxin [Candidatus Nanohalobium constans]|uniref:Ribonuclease VapC n=1 Tax=Candidatus Nanohalobium constans TaxID=2565781 RepID=A0A5Q0UHD1_9ARCH|nr:PIN domain-containing protein [Candidatus Nanohalobium constans]QGA80309.1 PIN domain-containing protein [Candidatus Nanohalobium constans]
MAKLLDTSFLIAYHNKRDEHHDRARELRPEKIVVNDYIYAEVLDTIYSSQGKKKAVNYSKFLEKSAKVIPVTQPIMKKTVQNFQEKDLSFTDASIAATAQKLNMDIVSFDKDFDQFKDVERIH